MSSPPPMAHNSLPDFHTLLRSSRRIIALCGAGLSASSGLPTFRGAGGLWRNHDATALATMNAFRNDPGLVWLFYAYRRHMSLRAEPNEAHRALAALGPLDEVDFMCLTQNVDNLSQRAGHPPRQLLGLHGSLFNIKCSNAACDWIQLNNTDDPFCPALHEASVDPETPSAVIPLLNTKHRLKTIPAEDLPKCPKCETGLQRPAVVWFGENLNEEMIKRADAFIESKPLDMILVIGTTAKVWPAAGYINKARQAGAVVVTVNPDAEAEDEMFKVKPGDFAFGRDAAEWLPKMLQPVIGDKQEDGSYYKEY